LSRSDRHFERSTKAAAPQKESGDELPYSKMTTPPLSIKARQQEGVLELQWPDGVRRLPYRFLRGRCPCASCVSETTGIRVVDVEDVPHEIAPTNLQYTGNYAIKITWNDGHDTGLFTWENLELLCKEIDATSAT
jgi:DUF971 family protein